MGTSILEIGSAMFRGASLYDVPLYQIHLWGYPAAVVAEDADMVQYRYLDKLVTAGRDAFYGAFTRTSFGVSREGLDTCTGEDWLKTSRDFVATVRGRRKAGP